MNDMRTSGRGNSLSARDIATLVHPYTNLKVHEKDGPLVISRGKGVYVYDDSGKEYIEGLAGPVVHVARLFRGAAGRGGDAPDARSSRPITSSRTNRTSRASSWPSGCSPWRRCRCRRCFSRIPARKPNDTRDQARLVLQQRARPAEEEEDHLAPARLSRRHVAAASLTGLPANHRDFDLPIANVIHTDCPHAYRFARAGRERGRVRDAPCEQPRGADPARRPRHGRGVHRRAGDGRRRRADAAARATSTKIQAVLKKYDVLFIADEVISGFGRTGNMWGAQTFDIKPDMVTMAKALSSAYLPISAVLISEPIYRAMVEREREDRHVRPRLHLFRASGRRGGRARDAEDLRGARHRRAMCAASRRASQAGFQKLAEPSAGRRGRERRPDRRDPADASRSSPSRPSIPSRPWRRSWPGARRTTASSAAPCSATASRCARR